MKTEIKEKEKSWIFKCSQTEQSISAAKEISKAFGINPIIAKLLYQRGYKTAKAAKAFLYMETEVLTNPFSIKDMDAAVNSIKLAVENNKKITIYGDYDVDGVTSVCALYLYLKSIGAVVDYYIPNRVGDGYGVSKTAIASLAASGTGLIITVDTGITANDEVEYAKSIGIDFVITDHHECRQELPEALAVVNPHRPDCPSEFKELAGVGVVFKLLCAYEERVNKKSPADAALKIFSEYADIIAIGTIADVMPIKDENRLIVSYGLSMMEKNRRTGLSALIDASVGKNDYQRQNNKKRSTKITSSYIGYTLAPRINAAGRIRSATVAVELFLSDDYQKAYAIAEQLCEANKERQAEENRIIKEAYREIEKYGYDKMPVIVIEANNWHHGVIGIVASRITEKYGKPSILVSFEGNMLAEPSPDDIGKGSGRSVKGINLVDALCYCNEELVRFGGHELAAGLSVTRANIDAFRNKINEYAKSILDKEEITPTIEADLEIPLSDVTYSLADDMRILEPYGVGNPVPNFVMRAVTVTELMSVSEGKHTRIAFRKGKNIVSAMYFSHSPASLGISVGSSVDVLFNLDINEWGGRKSVQLIVRDLKLNEESANIACSAKERFCQIWSGAKFSVDENLIPDRKDFAAVYRFIVFAVRSGENTFNVNDLLYRICRGHASYELGYIKLKVIIKVMQELNLIGIEELEEDVYSFRIYSKTTRSDLEKSNLLRRLRSQLII